VGATERLVLFPTWLLLDLFGAGHVEHPWVRTAFFLVLICFGSASRFRDVLGLSVKTTSERIGHQENVIICFHIYRICVFETFFIKICSHRKVCKRKRFRPHKVYIPFTSRVYPAMSVCPYERCDLGNYKSYNTGNRQADSWDFCAENIFFRQCATPTLTPTSRPQTSKNRKCERAYLGNYQK